MRRTLYLLFLFLVSVGVLYYLVEYSLPAYDEQDVPILKNVFVLFGVFVFSFTNFFAFIHSIIDKVFFKKFYQNPDFATAIRRGSLLGAILVGVETLKVFDFLTWYNILLVVLMGVLIEILIIGINLPRDKEGNRSEEERT